MAQSTEPKLREAIARVKGKESRCWILDHGTFNGKRTRRSFKSKTEAEYALKDWHSSRTWPRQHPRRRRGSTRAHKTRPLALGRVTPHSR